MLTIFSNTVSSILVSAGIMLYLCQIIVMATVKEHVLPMKLFSLVNLVITVITIFVLFINSTPYEEILLVSVASCAFALTVMKLGKGA